MKNTKQIFETDWLGSSPVFYNVITNQVSQNINDVIDYSNFKFHPEGLANYLEWGYSVFGQTSIEGVKFLLPNQTISLKDNKIKVSNLSDPVLSWKSKQKSSQEVVELIKNKVQSWEKQTKGDIIIPASGGYDSRFLCSLIKDKSRAHVYTFGTSRNQSESYEVVYARDYTDKLKLPWTQIELANYHRETSVWLSQFGPSTHAHGMYQINFYRQINQKGNLLSGIIGDAWTGKVSIPMITRPRDLSLLGYSHGLNGSPQALKIKFDQEIRSKYYQEQKEALSSPNYRLITAMRQKMLLLSYLLRIPQSFGFKPYGPFLDYEIVMSLLDLNPEEKIDRKWQVDYFRKHGIMSEDKGLRVNRNNNLDQHTINQYPLQPLNVALLSEILKPEYLEWINSHISSSPLNKLAELAFSTKYLGYLLNQLKVSNTQMEAYSAYLTVLPLEYCLRRREGISD